MKNFFFVGLLVFGGCFGMRATSPLGEILSNRIFAYKSTHSSPFLEKLESDDRVSKKRVGCIRKLVGLNWWHGDDQFPLAIHNCILHAIGLNRRGGADSHVRFDWHKLDEVQNSVFLIHDNFDISMESKQEIVENGGLEDNEHVKAYFCLAKIFSLAMSSLNYRFVDNDNYVEIFLPESALMCKTLPFLWQTPEFAFAAFDSGVVTGNGAVLINKFRLGLSLTEDSFSLFPSFYPVSEGGLPISKSDLRVSDTSIVFPSSLDILYRLSSRRDWSKELQFSALLNFVKFDENSSWFSPLLNSLLSQGSDLDFFLKEFLNVVIFAYSKDKEEVKSFEESCSALLSKHSDSAAVHDFLCGILYDNNGGFRVDGELLGLLRTFVPQLMFFVRDVEIPFFLCRMPDVGFSATRAFLECCGAADRIESFLAESKKRQGMFENLLETSESKETLKSLRQSAEKAIQDIKSFLGDVLRLVNPEEGTEDFLFFKRIIALYFTKQPGDLEENIKDKLQRTKAQMGKISAILGIVRFYMEKIEDIDEVLKEK